MVRITKEWRLCPTSAVIEKEFPQIQSVKLMKYVATNVVESVCHHIFSEWVKTCWIALHSKEITLPYRLHVHYQCLILSPVSKIELNLRVDRVDTFQDDIGAHNKSYGQHNR